jgi:hypothetical protein
MASKNVRKILRLLEKNEPYIGEKPSERWPISWGKHLKILLNKEKALERKKKDPMQ